MNQSRDSLEMQNQCAEIKIRAERRVGELLKDMAKGGQRSTGGKPVTKSPVKTLADIGVTPDESKRFQKLADVPADVLEQHIHRVQAEGQTLTTSKVLKGADDVRANSSRVVMHATTSPSRPTILPPSPLPGYLP